MANPTLSVIWVRDPVSAWVPGYTAWVASLRASVRPIIEGRMEEIDAWMKENAPWKDRTGNARRSLHTELEEMLEGYVLYFLYSIPIFYSVYLEYDHQGRFSILEPALDHWGPILLNDLRSAL